MKTYETATGTYDIYIDFDIEEGKKLEDYAYFQHTDEIVSRIADPDDYWAYCSATALAQCLSLYYNDKSIIPTNFMDDFNNGFNWGNDEIIIGNEDTKHLYGTVDDDYENKTTPIGTQLNKGDIIDPATYADTYASSIINFQEMDEYTSEIVSSLKIGRPVITCVYRYTYVTDDDTGISTLEKISTHYVTIIGVKSGINLDDAQYTDFVMFDAGTTSDKKLSTLDDTYKGYTYYPYNYRIITPYLINENGEFILDENGNKTTDVSYAQVSNSEENNEESPSVFDIIDNTDMPEHEKNRIKGIIQRDIDNKINYAIEKAKMMMSLSILKAVQKKSNTASTKRADPFILDLDGDGFNVETKENGVNFDLDKNGFAEKINWTKKDGFLCLDLNGNGSIDNGGELFGDQTM